MDHTINTEGAIEFPVFHKNHPCLRLMRSSSDPIEAQATMIDVIEDSSINAFLFLMPIKLGTPPIMNLVAIDTGSTLSWVQCQPCEPHCHDQAAEAGQIFDPTKSTTFRHARCISRDCFSIKHELIRLQSANCMEKEDTCLYTMSFGGDTTGKVVRMGQPYHREWAGHWI
jgi:hypothetical protein